MAELNESLISHLRSLKEQLMTTMESVDFALAQAGGGDLVTWAGIAEHEQRCKRCGYWIFMNDLICAILTPSGMGIYIHRKCITRIHNAEEGRSHG